MNRRHLLITSLSMWSVAACGNNAPSPDALEITEKYGDIRYIGGEDLVHDVLDMAVAADGKVWVLTSFEPFITIIADGVVVSRFGKRGRGPGELLNPWYLLTTNGGVGVWDVGQRRLQMYGSDGQPISETDVLEPLGFVMSEIRQVHFGEPLRMVALGNHLWLERHPGQLSRPSHVWKGELARLDSAGRADTTITFSALPGAAEDELPPVFAPAPLWTACGDRLYVVDPISDSVFTYDSTGHQVSAAKAELLRVPVTKADVERWVDRAIDVEVGGAGGGIPREARRAAARVVHWLSAEAPDLAPPVRVRCAGKEHLWIQLFSTASDPRGYGQLWQRAGDRSEVLQFPEGFQPMVFEPTQVFGVVTNELGVQRPAVVAR